MSFGLILMEHTNEIQFEYDDMTDEYVVIWQPPLILASGKTKGEALLDLQKVIQSCSNSSIHISETKKCHKGG